MKIISKIYCEYTLILWTLFHTNTYASNILGIYPFMAKSHFQYSYAILETLANAGHSVTLIAPLSRPNTSTNIQFVNSQVETYQSENRTFEANVKHVSVNHMLNLFLQTMKNDCHNVYNLPFVQKLLHLNNHGYDVMFVEIFLFTECYMPIAWKLQIPVIGTVSLRPSADIDWQIGNPHPLINPFLMSNFGQKMNFFQRIGNTYQHLTDTISLTKQYQSSLDDFYRLYTPGYIIEMDKEYPSLTFVNTHASIFPRALIPTVVEVAGIHIKPLNSLTQDIRNFIEEAPNGVILFSLGTWMLAKDISNDEKKVLIQTFASLSQRVIFKFDEEIENLSPNVLRLKWIPQFEILAHNNVKLFITHCGINSLYEAIQTETPVVMIPNFADQFSNAARAEELGIGINLKDSGLEQNRLLQAIETVWQNSTYTVRMKELSSAFRDRPISPKESIIYWTEYVLKFNGTKNLRTFAADMPLYQYFLLDVISFVTFIFISIIFVLYFIVRTIYKTLNYKMRYNKETKFKTT